MDRLTPNLWAMSAQVLAASGVVTRELDFNLARRSGLVINRVIGQFFYEVNTTSGHEVAGTIIQELDTDPDNVTTEFGGAAEPNLAVLDSSRPFRQVAQFDIDTAAGRESPIHTLMEKDWTNLPETKRPISITSLRHHFHAVAVIAMHFHAELHIDYFIVELSLEEIGILNASRR